MSLLPEEAQQLTDLRSHMLRNIQQGKPAHEGLTQEAIAKGLAFLRRNRQAAAEAGAKKAKRDVSRATKAPKKDVVVDPNFLGGIDLD